MECNCNWIQYFKRSLRRPIGAPSSFYRATDNSTAELNRLPVVEANDLCVIISQKPRIEQLNF